MEERCMNLEALYARLPAWGQQLAVSAQGYRLKRERYGPTYSAYKKKLPKVYRMSYKEVSELQLVKLREFISFAKERSPFYSKLYKNVYPEAIKGIGDLKRLPVVDKEQLRRHIDEVYAMPRSSTILVRRPV